MKVEYLDDPVKSDKDKKNYRVIKLKNGLVALLISDIEKHTEDKFDLKETGNNYENNSFSNAENNNAVNPTNIDPAREDADKKDETNIKNKLAACGLCISVGSFSDPPEIQGLAHFLEHMVFMGSSKFPEENDFESFITNNGGSNNAFTASEMTTFYFDILDNHFSDALDRFSHFFINPLMKIETIDRESEIIESEFQLSFPNDDNKKDQMTALWVKQNHPAGQFNYGNLESLKKCSSEELFHELHKFRNRHYSAHRMTVAVQASFPLEKIEDYVKRYFSDIPSNDLPPLDFSRFEGPLSFEMLKFHKIYRFKPVEDTLMLEISWPMKSSLPFYRSKTYYYIAWIIGHEGRGSLISYLRRKFWAFEITAGNCTSNSIFCVFQISIKLTNEGFNHIEEICNLAFSYLNMLKQTLPSRRIFDEIQHIENVIFRFLPENASMENVGSLCQSMQIYPPKDYLVGGELLFDFEPEEIIQFISALDPEKVNILIYDPKSNLNRFDKTEYWFKARYCEEDIPRDWIEKWKTIEPCSDFHLPEPNPFLATDFTLIPLPENIPQYPVQLHKDSLITVWHKPDPKFHSLECYISLSLKTPLMNISPENSAMGDLLNTIMQQMLKDEIYAATCTKLEHVLYTSPRGLLVVMNGWSQKLPLLLYTIIKYYLKFHENLTEDIFRMGKEQELKWYYNESLDTHDFIRDIQQSILSLNHWSRIVKHAALSRVTYDQFLNFVTHFWDCLEINFLVQGNMSREDALYHGLKCAQILNSRPLLQENMPWTRICQIPLGERCCRVQHFDKSNINSAVWNYYQAGSSTRKTKAIIETLNLIMEEPLYSQLRTNQNLSYSLSCDSEDDYGIYGFSIIVYHQTGKYRTDFIDEKIEEFIKDFKEKLKKMSVEEFEEIKKTLIRLKMVEVKNLKEEFDRNWVEIELDRFTFDKHLKDSEAISQISLKDCQKWLNDHTMGENEIRKLTIQVIGRNQEKVSTQIETDNLTDDLASLNLEEEKENNLTEDIPFEPKYVLKYLKDFEDSQLIKLNDYYISNIEEFKTTLMLYPVSYINK